MSPCPGNREKLRLFWSVYYFLFYTYKDLFEGEAPESGDVLKDQCYSSLLHGIKEVKEDQMDSSIVNLTEEER